MTQTLTTLTTKITSISGCIDKVKSQKKRLQYFFKQMKDNDDSLIQVFYDEASKKGVEQRITLKTRSGKILTLYSNQSIDEQAIFKQLLSEHDKEEQAYNKDLTQTKQDLKSQL